jgi:hypothetical protein
MHQPSSKAWKADPRHAGGKPALPKQGHPINGRIRGLEKFAEKVNGLRAYNAICGAIGFDILWVRNLALLA